MKTSFPKKQSYPGGFAYNITDYCGDKTEYKRICALDIDGDGVYKIVGVDKNNLPWVIIPEVKGENMARKEIKIYIEEHKK